MQAYEGYFENGQFYTAGEIIRIPERRRVFLTVLEEPANEAEAQRLETEHAKAWREFFDAVNGNDEEIPDTFEKVNFKREVNL